MSRRSLYKPGRVHTTLYGPKTDAAITHWTYDWVELATTREEEAEGPQRANTFKVKTWVKLPEEQFKPVDDGVPGDVLPLTNQIQAAADEIADKEAAEAASLRGTSEAPDVKAESEPATGHPTVDPTPEPSLQL